MMQTIWLKNLVDGRTLSTFNQLLQKRKDSVQYEVFVGTSGKIIETNINGCPNGIYNGEYPIPKYIWTYLKSLKDHMNEEFVVIGVNTPFAEYNRWNETVFCEDMCDSIEWLKPMEKTRQMPYMGYMFCCNVTDEVKKFLDGFPNVKH